jgi:hypothetical protein
MGRPVENAAQAHRAAESRREARQSTIRIYSKAHGVTALRQDWSGSWRPLSGPCRLALEGGELVPTSEPGTDEENFALVADLTDKELLAALPDRWRGWLSDAITETFL